jgi:hypothetical protein
LSGIPPGLQKIKIEVRPVAGTEPLPMRLDPRQFAAVGAILVSEPYTK